MRILLPALALLLTASAGAQSTPPPAPVLGAYLGSISVDGDFGGPYLKFDVGQFVFLPSDEGTADLYRNGERVAGYTWTHYTGRAPFTNISPLQLAWPEFHPLGYELTEGGDYEIVYSVDGDPFWRMPFTVTKSGGDDPYNPDATYRLDGLWNDHAYVLHDKGGEGAWDVKLWLHAADFTRSERYNPNVDSHLYIYREGESEPTLQSSLGAGFINNGNWVRTDFRLQEKHRYDSAAGTWEFTNYLDYDRLLPDGEYRIEVHVADALYGTYPLSIRDGVPVHTGAQAPGADPMTRIDGGGAAYWVYRQ
ncbi:MAG: hypothetical protein AAGK21_09370 [Bacteroidota bacterium]